MKSGRRYFSITPLSGNSLDACNHRKRTLRYLDRLLFVLRFSGFPAFIGVCHGSDVCISEEGRNCVRGEDKWQETFEKIIHGDSEDIVKLVAIVAYYEACESSRIISKTRGT
jgi:hypothetical protein